MSGFPFSSAIASTALLNWVALMAVCYLLVNSHYFICKNYVFESRRSPTDGTRTQFDYPRVSASSGKATFVGLAAGEIIPSVTLLFLKANYSWNGINKGFAGDCMENASLRFMP